MALTVVGSGISFMAASLTVFWFGLWAWWKFEDVKQGEGRLLGNSFLVFGMKLVGLIGCGWLAGTFVGGDVRDIAAEGRHFDSLTVLASGDAALLKVVIPTALVCLSHCFHKVFGSADLERMKDWLEAG